MVSANYSDNNNAIQDQDQDSKKSLELDDGISFSANVDHGNSILNGNNDVSWATWKSKVGNANFPESSSLYINDSISKSDKDILKASSASLTSSSLNLAATKSNASLSRWFGWKKNEQPQNSDASSIGNTESTRNNQRRSSIFTVNSAKHKRSKKDDQDNVFTQKHAEPAAQDTTETFQIHSAPLGNLPAVKTTTSDVATMNIPASPVAPVNGTVNTSKQSAISAITASVNAQQPQNESSDTLSTEQSGNAITQTRNANKASPAGWFSVTDQSWLTPTWIWNSITDGTNFLSSKSKSPVDEIETESKESKRAKKILTDFFENQQSCWAFLSHDKEVIIGELAIFDSEFEDEPIMVFSKLPQTKMEISEVKTRSNLKANGCQSVVFPEFNDCYRALKWKTQLRLVSRKLFKNFELISSNIPLERHVYHDPVFTNFITSGSSNNNTNNAPMELTISPEKFMILHIQNFLPTDLQKSYDTFSVNLPEMTKELMSYVNKWMLQNDVLSSRKFEIESITLKGKGSIMSQVENFYLMIIKNWILKLAKTDYLLIVANFNSSTIAAHLLSKLVVKFPTIFHKIKKIGVISINGIWLGPFLPDYVRPENHGGTNKSISESAGPGGGSSDPKDNKKSKGDAKKKDKDLSKFDTRLLNEIIDYSDPKSALSIQLSKDMKSLLGMKNIKFSFICNLNDQFVPLYSSLCYQFNHPNINRMAIFNKKGCVIDPFILKLINACLLIKNLGYEDYNLLTHLSSYLQNYMKQFSNASKTFNKLYTNDHTYIESLKFCFETTTLFTNSMNKLDIEDRNNVDLDDQTEEGQMLRGRSTPTRGGKEELARMFKKRSYYLNNQQDVIKFHHTNFTQLVKNFNDFQYPWILNKFIQELRVIEHLQADEMIQELRDLIKEWAPKDSVSVKLKTSFEVLSVEEYL